MNTLETKPNTLHVVENPRTGRKYLLPKNIDINNYSIRNLSPLTGNDSKLLIENNPEMTNKDIEITQTEVINDIVKRPTDTKLIEIEDIPIVNAIENDGVSEGVDEGVQPFLSGQ